jgi:predicted GNAT family N-acyltransferase
VFERAAVPDRGREVELELGYVVVAEDFRGRNLSCDLVRHALTGYELTPLFATSRTDRMSMHRTLKRFNFDPIGHPYPSAEEESRVQLFVRTAAQQALGGDGGRGRAQ